MVRVRFLETALRGARDAARRARAYGELVMFSHSIFSFSFLALSACVASGGFPEVRTSVLLTAAFLGARTCANALNRIIDRDIDAANERTRARHLPAGLLLPIEAGLLAAASFLVLSVAAWFLNPVCVALLPVAGVLILVYSYTKRFTWLCHLVLGVACAAAPAGAWIAVRGTLEFPGLLLAAANALWVAGFDIVYAVQDIEFDRAAGLHSIPARFGKKPALDIAVLSHFAAVAFLVVFGAFVRLGFPYFSGIIIVAALLVAAALAARENYRAHVLFASYSANQMVSLVLLAATILEFAL
ncbi:MAG TPA: 4-hydroxybenzoate octaprenyltransferase [Treponema sp.]|nr:4-hydroxybenzoate octaprenyltransferase [Treponema sp.]